MELALAREVESLVGLNAELKKRLLDWQREPVVLEYLVGRRWRYLLTYYCESEKKAVQWARSFINGPIRVRRVGRRYKSELPQA
jgi:hypothetical protein